MRLGLQTRLEVAKFLLVSCFAVTLGACAKSAHAMTADELACGVNDKSFDNRRRALQSQKDAEYNACAARIDQINNTFAWHKHCVVNINDKYRPHFKQIEDEGARHQDEARRCVVAAKNKRDTDEKRANIQAELNRRSEQQQQNLRVEKYQQDMAKGNAEREAYNRRATQLQAQQAANQQAEYQRQQSARRASAETAQQSRQDWNNTVSSVADMTRSSRLGQEQSLGEAVAQTNKAAVDYQKESGDLARIIEAARAEQARISSAAREVRSTVTLENLAQATDAQTTAPESSGVQYRRSRDNPQSSGSVSNNGSVNLGDSSGVSSGHDCSRLSKELAQIRIPADAPVQPRLETVLYLKSTALDLMDRQCPGTSTQETRASLTRDYEAAAQACKNAGLACKPTRHY
ncbi:MAG TPA: hypothetical protein VGE55_03510 [Limnobacter sp.]|uniref:hypothetical protein n=1 Tax=Limnobacter sp. TaxID=2003368 RepID=UPI002EDB1A05